MGAHAPANALEVMELSEDKRALDKEDLYNGFT